jgi:Protein of unknown function (DUF2793)
MPVITQAPSGATSTSLSAVDARLTSVEAAAAASAPVARQENAYSGGLANGARLLVGPAPTGVLAGFANQVATVVNNTIPTFTFAAPYTGLTLFVSGATLADGSGVEMVFNGTAWEQSSSSFVANLTTNDAKSGLAASQGPVLLAKIDAPAWDSAATYLPLARMTFADGFVYRCLVATAAGENPVTHPTKWTIHEQPNLTTVKADYDLTLPVLSATTVAQPASPTIGDRYIVPTGATGTAWLTQDGKVAQFGTAWTFTLAPAGTRIHVRDTKIDLVKTATIWERDGADLAKSTVANLSTVAVSGGTQFMPLFDAAGAPAGKASVTAIASNGSIPAAEFGSVDLAASFLYPGPANTYADVTGMLVSIPSAGTWEIRGQLRTQARQQDGDVTLALFDGATLLAGSEVQPLYVTGTNNANDSVQATGSFVMRVTTTGVKSYQLRMKAANYNVGSVALQSDGNGRSRLAWEKISGFTALVTAVVAEGDEAQLATTTQSFASISVEENLNGCVTPVLGAGRWRIEAFVAGGNNNNQSGSLSAWITDQTNTIVPNTGIMLKDLNTATNHLASGYASADVVSDGSKSYKIRGVTNNTNGTFVRNSPYNGANNSAATTKIRWTKIAGNVPISNSSESVVAISDSGTATNTTTTSTTYVDIPNAVVAIPSAGEWEVTFDQTDWFHNTANQVAYIAICDMAGTVLAEKSHQADSANITKAVSVVVPSFVTTTAVQLKAMFRTQAGGTSTVRNGNTVGNLRPRFRARKVGGLASIPGTTAEVSGSVSLLSNQVTAANTTPVDTSLQVVAPEAGTYEVEYEVVGSNAAAGGSVDAWIADGSNNQQADSLKRVYSATSNARVTSAGSCRMVMAAGDVAKLRFGSGGANVTTLYGTGVDGTCRLKWRKVSNYGALAVREPEIGYFRLTADLSSFTGGTALGGTWAAEAGFANTVQQVTPGGAPVFRLKAGRWYELELYPYFTGIGDAEYHFWSWRTAAGVVLPATAMGGSAYLSGTSREEMTGVVKAIVRPSIDTDVTIWTDSVATSTLSAESSSRSTSIFIKELPRTILA